MSVRKHTRHLRRLATDQGAAQLGARPRHTGHQRGDHLGPQRAHIDVVEKEQRSSPADNHVVHAGVYQVLADGVVAIHHGRQPQLGANRVGRGDQDRVVVALQSVHGAKGAYPGQHVGTVGGRYDIAYTTLDRLGGDQVDSRRLVSPVRQFDAAFKSLVADRRQPPEAIIRALALDRNDFCISNLSDDLVLTRTLSIYHVHV